MGLVVSASGSEALGALGGQRDLSEWGLYAKLARRVGPFRPSLAAGAARRSFRDGGDSVARAWVPELRPEVALGLGRTVAVELFVASTVDLRAVDLRVDGEVVQTLFPVRPSLGARVVLRGAPDP